MIVTKQSDLIDKILPNTIVFGDCLNAMKLIPDKSIDLSLTDPPYGILANHKWDTIIPFDLMWKELNRIIKPQKAIAIFGTQPFISKLILSNELNFKYCWYMEKIRGANFSQFNYHHYVLLRKWLYFQMVILALLMGLTIWFIIPKKRN